MINVGSDFSGVGAFDQALRRLKIDYNTIFSCDMDKYARQTYIHNYGEPQYYPTNVYNRDIPKDPLDIYMTSPPCQAFSLAGKRKGESEDRGVLFYNSHEFIVKNKPRYFIFENVKGLLSDDNGKTFQRWVAYLGGKSVNGNPVIFPMDEAVPYHIYHKVLNAKNYGVPQNRERIFIIGIRDDEDNTFRFPKEERLEKRLKDVLEDEIDEKYYLSDEYLMFAEKHKDRHDEKGTGFGINYKDENDLATTIRANASLCPTDNHLKINNYCKYNFHTCGNFKYYLCNTCEDGNNYKFYQDAENEKIRRLTPRECFRLMDFPDTFDFSVVSNSQAYKQAGNSIVVSVLEKIINNLKL